MQLAPIGASFPWDHHVTRRVAVPDLKGKIFKLRCSSVDATSMESYRYEAMPGSTRAYGENGEFLIDADPEIVQWAARGGGPFYEIAPNGLVTCQTLEEFELLEELAAEELALELAGCDY